ncbi:RNA-directed DNA polymerase, eukaryota [Tanacetum coccineum]
MYKFVKKMKLLKKPLNKLSWCKGNVFENVKQLKEKLKIIQEKVDKNPYDKKIKKEATLLQKEYTEAVHDEHKYRVESICNEEGKRFEGDKVTDQFVKHFEEFLGKEVPVDPIMNNIFRNTLSSEEAMLMERDVNDKEIKEALFDIDSDKASGPDGYSSEFFKKAWDIVGEDFCSSIKEFFISGQLLGEINATIIALIPKLFRRYFGQIWFSSENGNMDHEMCDYIKIFYLPEWGDSWTLQGGRGLRQGDPISPYLFTLVMEVFTLIMMKNIEESDEFGYHFGCKELKLSHMCFADDLLVLCKGNKESLKVIKKSLKEFNQVSGLTSNLGKSVMFFGSIKDEEKHEMLNILPFKCGKLPVRYLGVPLLAKRLSVQDCNVLIDRVDSRINCWRNKTLSYAGRVQLIASVLSSMQLYWASVYLLPNSMVNDIDKLLKRFLWNSGDSAKGKARVAWKVVCRPKTQGGLGIKPLRKWFVLESIRHEVPRYIGGFLFGRVSTKDLGCFLHKVGFLMRRVNGLGVRQVGWNRESSSSEDAAISLRSKMSRKCSTSVDRDLWKVCNGYGTVVDVFIPNKRSKAGKRFAFVRFINVLNLDRLIENLKTIWIGRFHLSANLARFERPKASTFQKEKPVPSGNVTGFKQSIVHNQGGPKESYSSILKPSLVLDDSCLVNRDLTNCVMGEVLQFSSINNLQVLLSNEGFHNTRVVYLGGLWVMIELKSSKSKSKFMEHVGVASWFRRLCNAQSDFAAKERIVWVDIEGVPLNAWTRSTFQKISSKWGELVELEDGYDDLFARKRICIKTSQTENILESFKLIVKGKVFWARAKELFVWSPSFKDVPEKELFSDDESAKINEQANNLNNDEVENASEVVSDTYFGDNGEVQGFEHQHGESNDKEVSSDPFNIYDLLDKRTKEVRTTDTSTSIPYPPGFTPANDIPACNNQDIPEAESVRPPSRSARSNSRVLEEAENSVDRVSSESFSNGVKIKEGGSILEILEEMITVGQTMGFSMEGCTKDMEKIIGTQGEQLVFR